jgi:hypothetical protein
VTRDAPPSGPVVRMPPASSSSQPGADSCAGVDTLGRYGTTAGPPSSSARAAAEKTSAAASVTETSGERFFITGTFAR